MEKTKHSPAPWTTLIGERGATIHIADDYNHPLTFHLKWDGANSYPLREEAQANALLITAAPELLKALQDCTEAMKNFGYVPPCLNDGRRAISKALGTTYKPHRDE